MPERRSGAGLLVVFEGVEGAGKTSHIRRTSARLERSGIAHISVREPGGTEAGERIRRIVLDPASTLQPETELLLVLAARAEFVRRVVGPALDRGELVLADRYELSTFAYQGAARGLGLEQVRVLNRFATGGIQPDATVLLTVEPALGQGRKRGTRDRLERETEEFHRRVARAYADLARTEPGIIVVPSDGTAEEVQDRIWSELSARWPERFPPDG